MGVRIRVSAIAASAAVGLGVLSGCSFSVGATPTVSRDTLAAQTKKMLEANAGTPARSVTCDGDLEGKVGSKQRCVLTTMGGTRLGVTATVTGVEGSTVNFSAVVDDKPME